MTSTRCFSACPSGRLAGRFVVAMLLLFPAIGFRTTLADSPLLDVALAIKQMQPRVAQTITFPLPNGDLPKGGHLQGIQRLGDQIVITGSSETFSYYLTVDPDDGTSKLTKLLQSRFRHAGGFQVFENRCAAIGIEDNASKDRSLAWILDLAADEPESPQSAQSPPQPLIEIKRQGPPKRATAGALGLARVEGKMWLVVGSWDSATLDFYESNDRALHDPDCRFTKTASWFAESADRSNWSDAQYGSYQNINLVIDRLGAVFLLGFCREDGVDRLDLFQWNGKPRVPVAQRLRKIMSKTFKCRRTTFQAGAGIHIDSSGKLYILSCSHRDGAIEIFR